MAELASLPFISSYSIQKFSHCKIFPLISIVGENSVEHDASGNGKPVPCDERVWRNMSKWRQL